MTAIVPAFIVCVPDSFGLLRGIQHQGKLHVKRAEYRGRLDPTFRGYRGPLAIIQSQRYASDRVKVVSDVVGDKQAVESLARGFHKKSKDGHRLFGLTEVVNVEHVARSSKVCECRGKCSECKTIDRLCEASWSLVDSGSFVHVRHAEYASVPMVHPLYPDVMHHPLVWEPKLFEDGPKFEDICVECCKLKGRSELLSNHRKSSHVGLQHVYLEA